MVAGSSNSNVAKVHIAPIHSIQNVNFLLQGCKLAIQGTARMYQKKQCGNIEQYTLEEQVQFGCFYTFILADKSFLFLFRAWFFLQPACRETGLIRPFRILRLLITLSCYYKKNRATWHKPESKIIYERIPFLLT